MGSQSARTEWVTLTNIQISVDNDTRCQRSHHCDGRRFGGSHSAIPVTPLQFTDLCVCVWGGESTHSSSLVLDKNLIPPSASVKP